MQEMKVGPTSGAEYLLRRQQGQKMKLKEKFVEIYDMFLTVMSTFTLFSTPFLATVPLFQSLHVPEGYRL
jgi:hypothetical protein